LITFNGNEINRFKHRKGETQAQAILRLITIQLGNYTRDQSQNLVVDRLALDKHLGDNVVLLIDELNNLGVPLESDAAELLREMFLDRAGRYLVFTSHFPVSIEGNGHMASDMIGQVGDNLPSLRGVLTVDMSMASNLSELRGMSESCEGLTLEQAAWFGYVPSLIYSSALGYCGHMVTTPSLRFRNMHIVIDPGDELNILKRFIKELFNGRRDPSVSRYFGAFVTINADSLISYPLCYVKEIFELLSLASPALKKINNMLVNLGTHLQSQHTGLAWECTVQLAIILRVMQAHWFGFAGPFGLVPEGTNPDIAFRVIPGECESLVDAKVIMDKMILQYKSPTLIYVSSASGRFPVVDGFLVYTSGSSSSARIVGFQIKSGDVKPSHSIDKGIINGGAVLIRGRFKGTKDLKIKSGWTYMTSEEVKDFLGHSLLLAMPRSN
jgi:hypothetical protein